MKRLNRKKQPVNKNLVELKQYWNNFNTKLYYKYLLSIQ